MMLITILDLLRFLIAVLFPAVALLFLLVKFIILPPLIRKIVRDIPIDKDLSFDDVTILEFHEEGLDLSLSATVLGTKPPFSIPASLFWIQIDVNDSIRCFDAALQDVLCHVSLSEPLLVTMESDVKLRQSRVSVNLSESTQTIRNLVKRLFIAGPKELDRLSVLVKLSATIRIAGFMTLNNVSLDKTIPVAPLRERHQAQFKKHVEELDKLKTDKVPAIPHGSSTSSLKVTNEASTVESNPDYSKLDTGIILVPAPSIQPLPVAPAMRSIVGGLQIEFPFPPRLNLTVRVIRFGVTLNGAVVARGSITGLDFSSESKHMKVLLDIVPSVVSSTPIRGLATTAKGVLKGAFAGAMNGLLYGDWGSGATVIGITDLSIETSNNSSPRWLQSILDELELEHDMNAVKRFGNRAKKVTRDVSEGLLVLAAGVVETAGKHGSKCSVM